MPTPHADADGNAARARFQAWEIVPALVVLAGYALCTAAALETGRTLDFGLAYRGGVEVWDTGHPESVKTWMSPPFLGAAMALVSRVVDVQAGARALTLLNAALAAAALFAVFRRLRGAMPPAAWWLGLALASTFPPLVSTLLFRQFNLIVLVLALAGFESMRRGRPLAAGALVAASVALKPIAVLLPFAMLGWRESRKAGAAALLGVALLTLSAQGFFAWRAHDLRAADPRPALDRFRSRTAAWTGNPENFSPRGLLYRESRDERWRGSTVFLLAGLALLVALARRALRDEPGTSWDVFAFACLLSPMLGPVAWSHYQVFLAPMLLLLLHRFSRDGADAASWLGLALAFALSALILRPPGTVPGGVRFWLTGHDDETLADVYRVAGVAQLAQYVLFLVACAWYRERGTRPGRDLAS